MRVVIATVNAPFASGGAEVLVEDLRRALLALDHQVDVVALPWSWSSPERIMDHMAAVRLLELTESGGRPIDRLIAMKFPAYLIRHPNKVVWLMHQQRQAYELWNDGQGLSQVAGGAQIRDLIHRADRLGISESRGFFTISRNNARRLKRTLGLDAEVLLPPPRNADKLYREEAEDYVFCPSRLAPLKRQDLVVEALAQTEHPVRAKFAGFHESSPELQRLRDKAQALGVAERIDWLAMLSEKDLLEAYARALAVVFPTFDEDYGYITVEGMLASKPIITCTDSGGPLEWVLDQVTGWIVEPTPASIAQALDSAWQDRESTRKKGEAGRDRWHRLAHSWRHIVDELLA